MSKITEISNKIANLKQNRLDFFNECIEHCNNDFLRQWDVRSAAFFHKNFIQYILQKEKLNPIIKTKKYKKRFSKHEYIKKSTHKNPIKKDLQAIGDLSYNTPEFYGINIKYLEYKSWQRFKKCMLLVKKYIREYVIEFQKKTLCNLTDCYKNGILNRICELCGKEVDENALYCSECGGKFE